MDKNDRSTRSSDRSPDRSNDSRELLLKAAKTVFARKGYDGATVKELAEEAGVNVSLVSYYFGGKEGLFKACLEQFGRETLAVVQRILKAPESTEDLRVRLTLYAEEFVMTHVNEPELTAIIHRECALDLPFTREVFSNVFIKIFESLMQFLKSAQKSGFLRQDLDLHVTSALFTGGIIHMTRMDHLAKDLFGRSIRDKKFRDVLIQTAVQNFLSGTLRIPL